VYSNISIKLFDLCCKFDMYVLIMYLFDMYVLIMY